MKVLVFARTGSPNSRHRDSLFASKAHLPGNPESVGFKRMKALLEESLSLGSFEAGKQPHVFSRPLGTIDFAPLQLALRNTVAVNVQCLAPGDEQQGDVGPGPIEAKSYAAEGYATESYATEVSKEYTRDGR